LCPRTLRAKGITIVSPLHYFPSKFLKITNPRIAKPFGFCTISSSIYKSFKICHSNQVLIYQNCFDIDVNHVSIQGLDRSTRSPRHQNHTLMASLIPLALDEDEHDGNRENQ